MQAEIAKTAANDPALAATGEIIPEVCQDEGETGPAETDCRPRPRVNPEGTRVQDLLPEIYHLAQRVGGMKKLAEIVNNLQKDKE